MDPDNVPDFPENAYHMADSWIAVKECRYHNGERIGHGERNWGHRGVVAGDTAGVTWDGRDVHIILNGMTTRVFVDVPGPLRAVSDLFAYGVTKMSIFRPGMVYFLDYYYNIA